MPKCPAHACRWVVLGLTLVLATHPLFAQSAPTTRDSLNQQQAAAALVAANPSTPTTSDTQHVIGGSGQKTQNPSVGNPTPKDAANSRTRIVAEKDLPHIRYPLRETASSLVASNNADFNSFLAHYAPDLNTLLTGFTIEDKALLLRLWEAEEDAAILVGDRKAAEAALEKQKDLAVTQTDRALLGLNDYAFLRAWKKAGVESGDLFDKAYADEYAHRVNALPWDKVSEQLKAMATQCGGNQPPPQMEYVKIHLDPETAALHAVMLGEADRIVLARKAVQFDQPTQAPRCAVLTAYVGSHTKP